MNTFRFFLLCLVCISGAFWEFNSAYAQCSANAGSNTSICQGQSVTLGGNPTAINAGGGVSYSWSNGAGNTANPVVSPNSTTTYTVTLNGGGCNDVQSQITVTVLPTPNPSFTFNPTTACAGVPVSFTNATTTCTSCSYNWNFGNPASGNSANQSTQQNPSHSFVAGGNGVSTFNVSLTAAAANGCSATATIPITINQAPNASLTEDVNFTQCLGIADFYAYVTNASTGTVNGTTYAINWGDGTPGYSSTTPPDFLEHIYTGISIWTLTYTVTNPNGCSDVEMYEVSNITNPAIGVGTQGNTLQCGPIEFCFPLSNYVNNHPSTIYLVNYGDGSPIDTLSHPPQPSVCHTYSVSSCTNSPPFFTFSITADNNCTPSTGTISPIQVYLPPQANFTNPPAACVNASVPFTNTTTGGYNQGCNTASNFLWNFGDPASGANNTSTLANPSHTYSSPGTYIVTLTASNGGNQLLTCGSTTIQHTICIEQPPAPVFTVPSNQGCVPMTVNTSNTTSNTFASCNTSTQWSVSYADQPCAPNTGNYSFAGGTNANSLAPQFILNSAGTFTLQLQMTNSCGAFQSTQQVVVNTIPQVSVNALPDLCAGNSAAPSATVNGCNLPILSYAWTFPGGSPSSSNQSNPGVVNYTNQGSFPVSLTVQNACGPATSSVTANVLAPPNVQVLSSSPTNSVCTGSSLTLTATGASSYSWQPSTGLSSTFGSIITAAPTSLITYTVTGTTGNCTDQESITITVNPLPQVTAAGNFVMCQGQSIPLGVNVTGGTGPYNDYQWSNGSTLNNPAIANPTSSSSQSLNYSVQVSDANGCVGTGSVPLTVNPLPVVNAGLDVQLCNQPVPTTLSGFSPVSGGSGVWSGQGVTPGGIFTPAGVGTFTLNYCFTSSSTGCAACDQMIVTVIDPQPANPGPPQSICLNSAPVQLPPGMWTGSSQVSSSGLFTPSSIGTSTLTMTVGSGSCQTSAQTTVTVLPLPVVNAGPDQTVCAGTNVQLQATASSQNGAIQGYYWSGGTIGGTETVNVAVVPSGTTTYNVTAVDALGCNAHDQITVFVNPLPVVDGGSDQVLCNQPVPVQLVPVTPSIGGVWSGPGITPQGVFTPNGSGVFTVNYAFTNPITGCQNSDAVQITVNDATQANAGPDIQVCAGSPPVQLQPPVAGGTWSPSPVSSTGLFNPTTPGVYNLVYSIGSGTCLTQDNLQLTVYALPSANAGPDVTICQNQSTVLNGSASGGTGPYQYAWTPQASLNAPASATPSASPLQTTVYTLIITDANQCAAADAVQVSVNAIPVVNAGPDITLCNQPIPHTLTGFSPVSGGTGTWSGPGITNSSGIFVSPGVGTHQLTYTFSIGASGCSASDQLIVTVQPPIQAAAGNDIVLCQNEDVHQLTGFSPSSGGTWSGTGIINSSGGVFNPGIAGPGVHQLTLQVGTGTCLTSDVISVQVIAPPLVSSTSPESVCSNAGLLTLQGYQPSSGGVWEGQGITNPGAGIFNPAIGPGSYSLLYHYTDPLTGCSDSAFKQITVNPAPTAAFTVPPVSCTNSPLVLANNSTGANGYQWNFGNGASSTNSLPVYNYPAIGVYTISLTASNSFGCSHVISAPTQAIHPPQAALSVSGQDGCAPLYVEFTNNSVGELLTYNWSLGNGTTSNAITPAPVTYGQSDDVVSYTVSLSATNLCGTAQDMLDLTVFPQPVASFGTDLDVFCSPFTVNFNNTSVGNADSYVWDFGDGGPQSFEEEPGSHVFFAGTESVDYTIWLYLENECGADTASYTITVLPNTVTSFFNTNITWGCNPLTVNFTDYSDGATQVQYNFGGGNFTANPNPQYVFQQPGDYVVYQYADNGCSFDTSFVNITVYPSPVIGFTSTGPLVCEGEGVQFTSSSGNSVSVDWNFGDGGTSSFSNPLYTYSTPGTYSVTMTGTSLNGCSAQVTQPITVMAAPVAGIDLPSLVGCSPFNACFSNTTQGGVFYTWDFGNDNTSNQDAPCFNFVNFGAQPQLATVTLIAQNMLLCADTATVNLIIAPQPVSAFSLAEPSTCYLPASVAPLNLSQFANGFEWSVNNNVESVLTNPVFSWTQTGTYQIQLVASNQFGCSHSSQQTYTVHPLPTASFSLEGAEGCVPLEVQFANSSTGASSFQWIFGDGTSSQLPNPFHVYNFPGNYSVGLIAITANGCRDTLSMSDLIQAWPVPQADFTYYPAMVDIYRPVYAFLDASQGASWWLWNFGDGTSSNFQNIAHYFPDGGSWDVTLQVSNSFGCTSQATQTIWIKDVFNLYVPNAITPDGDGLNDYFKPEMSGKQLIDEYTFQIFDRWGTTLFETKDPDEPWTVNVFNGNHYAQNDVYLWQIKVKLKGAEKPDKYSGHVTVVR